MTATPQGETFRLALSYLERAQAELRHWETLRTSGKFDRTHYDLVRAKYVAHEREARKLVDAMRRVAQSELGPAKDALRQSQRAQKKLFEAVAAGGVDARKVNDQNRRLTEEIGAQSARVDELEKIVSGEPTESMGGQLKFPLEEYPKRLELTEAADLPRRKLTPQEKNLVAGVVMLILVLGTVFGLAAWRSTVRAKFTISGAEMQTGFIRVQCANQGNRAIEFYAPWPNGKPQAPAKARGANRSYGAILYVREASTGVFREVDGVEGVWKFRGAYVDEGTPISIAPGVTESIYLDVKRLREQGLTPDAVAVEFSRNGGGERVREEVQLAS